jgi:hypothetical protein
MAYSLDDFCLDTRIILKGGDNGDPREKIRQKLELLLNDKAFCELCVGTDNNSGVSHIFEDPDLHLCVLAYKMEQPRTSLPHDHGTCSL